MKKLLSVVLALAIVASCLAVFGAMATAASTEPKAVKVTHTAVSTTAKADFVFKASFLSAADFGDKDSLDVIFVLKNPLNKELSISVKAQEEGTYRDNLYTTNELNAENKPTGTRVGHKDSLIVPANGTSEFKLTFPKTGYFFHNGLNPKFADTNYLDKLCLRVQCGAETLEVGSVLEIAIKDNDALNEKFVNAAAGLTWMGRTTTVEKTTASTMSSVIKDALTATPTPVPTATPVVDKVITNGDVENGNKGWTKWNGGTTTIVADPDNANNHVAYFVPTGQYHSIGFDLAPAILQDAANGYKGAGAGTYDVTFKVKADEGKGGKFATNISAQAHTSKGATVGSYTTTENSWIPGTVFEMTDEWQTITGTIKVTQAFLDNIYAIYATGEKPAIYQLSFRLDGAALAYANKEYFGYYVDDLTITKQVEATSTATAAPGTLAPGATATPTPTPAPTPNAIEIHALQNTTYYINSATGVMDAADIKDGVLKKEITVENVGENDITVQLCIQATVKNSEGKDTWQGFANEGGYIEIAAGEKETIAIEVEFDGNVTTILDQEVPVEKLFFRLNFNNNTTLNEGDGVLIYGDQDLIAGLLSKTSSDKITYATKTLAIKGSSNPSNTGDVLPVALIATLAVATVALVVVAKKRKEN